ncbi:Cytochrome P450 [Dillenia turbinata]|uniref:Cytochrome P450 n=1 Tax=Dillenia turbinata TaxID=194707 RepID=A0AAN8V7U2_9MAGN
MSSSDPELNHYIFQQEGKLFQCWYTASSDDILGNQSLAAQSGLTNKYLRNLVLELYGIENLKQKLQHEMDHRTQNQLAKSVRLGVLDVKRESATGRKNVIKVVKEIIKERRVSRTPHCDFLNVLLKELDKQDAIIDEVMAVDAIFLLLFATYETTSTTITLAMKLIADHPSVLAELKNEHEAILQNRENDLPGVSIERILQIHAFYAYGELSSQFFFNHKWSVIFKSYEGTRTAFCFKEFHGLWWGARLCAGANFAKLQVAILLPYLVTKYSWKIIKGGDIIRKPGLVFPNGQHIKISEK